VTPDQVSALKHFSALEFDHPNLVDNQAAVFLDQLREAYGSELTLTSDARTREENEAADGSPTSLHLLGRAFDIRYPGSEEGAWMLLRAFFLALGWKAPDIERSIELELVHGPKDKHLHFGLFPITRPSRLIVAAD
jgi:hypothetical protein